MQDKAMLRARNKKSADARIGRSREAFVARAREVHGDKYDYDMSTFTKVRKQVRIVCKKHGEFWQTVDKHINSQQGCPSCGNTQSRGEEEVLRFMQIFSTCESRNRTVITPKELDIWAPAQRLAVEYCGMYWHSHESAEDERKNKDRHVEKHRMCQEQGVRLITLYETEWTDGQLAVKRLLRTAMGKMRGKVFARKCDVRSVAVAEARVFFDRYHVQGGNGAGAHFGLFYKDRLVACMRFTIGANDRGSAKREWTLTRYATRVTVPGGASRLFKAFLRAHDPEEVKSFSDNRLFDGGMYEQLGFELEQQTPPDYQVWSMIAGLRPKAHYQRRKLPMRLEEHGVVDDFDPATDERTEMQMTYLMGARRLYDCGKKRWRWKKGG
jgi:predicted  nucleic acid-binding Zn-ribbon protein